MLDRIQITDFQCHDKLRIKFDPQITAIVGPSDTGKSAVIRALKWVATNRPRGVGFIRDGQIEASVKVRIDGDDVARNKGGRKPPYTLKVPDGREVHFKAVGTDVPETIQECFNLGPENFQGQHDAPFWFSLTAGEVAKELNRIVDLEAIDTVMAGINSRLKKVKSQSEVIESRLGEAKERKQRLAFAPLLDKELTHLEGMVEEQATRNREIASLEALVDTVSEHGKKAEGLSAIVSGASEVLESGASVSKLIHKRDRLKERLDGIRYAADEVERAGIRVEAAKRELEEETGGVCPLCGGPIEE
jgi:DNA repair ATPase RecN